MQVWIGRVGAVEIPKRPIHWTLNRVIGDVLSLRPFPGPSSAIMQN
jgi:hypothetical protein